jgi:hypothetical protein
VLDRVGRGFHVILIGVSRGNALLALKELASVGATCTFFTAEPIISALKHQGFFLKGKRLLRRDSNDTPAALAEHNLRAFEAHLAEVATATKLYGGRPLSNLLAASSLAA